jgi:hypothetical protein
MTMAHKIQNVNEETEIIKSNKTGIVELKSTITEMKNSPDGFNKLSYF